MLYPFTDIAAATAVVVIGLHQLHVTQQSQLYDATVMSPTGPSVLDRYWITGLSLLKSTGSDRFTFGWTVRSLVLALLMSVGWQNWRCWQSLVARCGTGRAKLTHYFMMDTVSVLCRTGLVVASSIVRKRRLGLFGHVARLADDVPANQILQTCCKAQDGVRPSPDWRCARGRPLTTWIHQIPGTWEYRSLMLSSWLGTDRFGGKSQQREATADRFAPWWWWWWWWV